MRDKNESTKAAIYVPVILFAMTAATFALAYLVKQAYLNVFDIPYEHYAFNVREMFIAGAIVLAYTAVFAATIYITQRRFKDHDVDRQALFRFGSYAAWAGVIVAVISFFPLHQETSDRLDTFSSLVYLLSALVIGAIFKTIESKDAKKSKITKFFDKIFDVANYLIASIRSVLEIIFVFVVFLLTAPVIADVIGTTTAESKSSFYELTFIKHETGKVPLVIYEGSDKILYKNYDETTKKFDKSYGVMSQENIILKPYSEILNTKEALSDS